MRQQDAPKTIRAVVISDNDNSVIEEIARQFSNMGLNIGAFSDNDPRNDIPDVDKNPVTIVPLKDNHSSHIEKIIRNVRRHDPRIPIILVASEDSETNILQAFRAGASDYLHTPIAPEDLRKCLERTNIGTIVHNDYRLLMLPNANEFIFAKTSCMLNIEETLIQIASTDSPVLISGESGTGKDLAAQIIHYKSSRRNGPYICVNCTAISDETFENELFGFEHNTFTDAHNRIIGKLRAGNSGTIFIDEIADMPLAVQDKLIRFLETGLVYPSGASAPYPVDIRIIAATNHQLENRIQQGIFRQELFDRLQTAHLIIPPLRDRREDIPVIIEHTVQKFCRNFGLPGITLSPESMYLALNYNWPGNVRELLNALESTFSAENNICKRYLEFPHHLKISMKQELSGRIERQHIIAALLETNWNKSEAAEKLHLSRMTLYRKIIRYGIRKNKQ